MSEKKSSSRRKAAARPRTKASATAKKRAGGAKKTASKSRKKKAARSIVRFPVVGIGASAGGLEALEELFHNLPGDTGLAFVVITHQHPGHTSLLPELLGKCTDMPVAEANDGMPMEPNHVYLGPPGGYLAIMKNALYLVEGPAREMPPLPIDFFFHTLADDLKERAVCIVLSGTGADGTLGLKAVKGEGGMVMVQEVQSARYTGMPSSAIATAMADYVMPPAAIPAQLVSYSRTMAHYRTLRPDLDDIQLPLEQPMRKIFVLLRASTGHDFSSYKPTTMRRRIERRMSVHQLKDAELYVRVLQENPNEIDVLFKDLLIGVTSFFRDPEAFKVLVKKALPALMNSRPDNSTIRVWIPGCGTGEEAYTLAILLRECMQKLGKSFDFQIFATDLDAEAIEVARTGRYSSGIAADVPADALTRCFVREEDTYTVRKEIREMIVFAPQNVIKDPPFTKLDLLCCRNLLIYFNAELQKRLLPIFHYALKKEGVLMLGPSESISGFADLFGTEDKKWKIFRRKESVTAPLLPAIPAQLVPDRDDRTPPIVSVQPPKPVHISAQLEKLLLSHFAPPTVVVNQRGDIVYTHGRTGAYLEPASGLPSINILEMAREGLRNELAGAIRQALSHDKPIVRERVRVKTNGDFEHVNVTVSKITEPETVRGLLLVTFRFAPAPPQPPPPEERREAGGRSSGSRVEALEREILYTRKSLQSTVEELETSNEELKSTNEELQSTNEELQSTNEELETSKEEMQSLNEELTTVNAELQTKVDELSHANDDMQNLLNSTDIATLFLDNHLNIKRYTLQAKKLIKLIPTDIGRPVADLVSDLRYDQLEADASEVLETLERKELEVESKDGTWFLLRMVPYRTSQNVIDGLVVTFVNIDQTKSMELAGRYVGQLLQGVFDTFDQPAMVLDEELRVVKANTAFCKAFSTNVKKTEGQMIYDVGGGEWDIPKLRKLLMEILPKKKAFKGFELSATFPKVGKRIFQLNAQRLERDTGLPGMILLTMNEDTMHNGS